jgi:ABC-type antimicrobial peptide transport system permease subunit
VQAVYRLPGIRALAFEAYGGPVREEDTRWRDEISTAGVLYGVESASGVGSWSLPISGGFAEGGDLGLAADQTVIGHELARDQGLAVGDLLLVRGIPLLVVGMRSQMLAFPGSDAGRRVYVTFDTLERLLRQRAVEKRVTLLVPSAESQEAKDLFLGEVATRLRIGVVRAIDDRLHEIVVNYPGAWTITASSSTEAVRHAQSLYDVLMTLVSLLGLAVVSLSLAATWGRSVSAENERIGLLKALGSTEGELLGDYLQRIMFFGSACGLAGVIVGQVVCFLLNGLGHEGAFQLVVTPRLAAGVFVGSVVVALASAAPAVVDAVRRDATSSLYVSAVESPGAARSGMEAMRGGS